ncbi:hypothetical protein BD309DRAFT_918148 [Dichomitus squalens]|uniref:Uncharacterized protein n=1 Tax=Dichomitus squalens TaxID=114155 RepID=A0A4Q9Q2U6_9APHY|nr:hypothetical protein BD309DRAFT_918148 [Dichomitus squalens]TBU61459.1 hypothetical protein BD310DRAFT_845663 [Dichomitus squalens]
MWLLCTGRAELHHFDRPDEVEGGYAILSHVWDSDEKSFQDMQDLRKRCEADGTVPRDLASEKIRESCIIAERHGHKWIWNDTCCIDKSSSSELSEAINSMYRYYSLARICYAYLRDVSRNSRGELCADRSDFRESKWHSRGWTLQELIAPGLLVFLSKEWEELGTKMELAELLQDITTVPSAVLRMEAPVSSMSVACRLSWAAGRETRRLEDQAYCLMGIFDIHMPTLYGEGQHAFHRLQEEIMKNSTDTSLFAWDSDPTLTRLNFSGRPLPDHCSPACLHDAPSTYLFARSPSDFYLCSGISFEPQVWAIIGDIPSARSTPSRRGRNAITRRSPRTPAPAVPSFTMTPFGCRAQMQVVEVSESVAVGVLRCYSDEHLSGRKHTLALLLTPCLSAQDPLRSVYHVGSWDTTYSIIRRTALVAVTSNGLLLRGREVTPRWTDIYITHRPPPSSSNLLLSIPCNFTLSPPFRVPLQTIKDKFPDWTLEEVTPTEPSWSGDPPMMLVFKYSGKSDFLVTKPRLAVILGRCALTSGGVESASSAGSHWADILFFNKLISVPHTISHQGNHIHTWPNRRRTRTFESHGVFSGCPSNFIVSVTICFTPCPMSPVDTLVLHLE